MTDHDHREFVPGCYRCELSRDEVDDSSPPRRPDSDTWHRMLRGFIAELDEFIDVMESRAGKGKQK